MYLYKRSKLEVKGQNNQAARLPNWPKVIPKVQQRHVGNWEVAISVYGVADSLLHIHSVIDIGLTFVASLKIHWNEK